MSGRLFARILGYEPGPAAPHAERLLEWCLAMDRTGSPDASLPLSDVAGDAGGTGRRIRKDFLVAKAYERQIQAGQEKILLPVATAGAHGQMGETIDFHREEALREKESNLPPGKKLVLSEA